MNRAFLILLLCVAIPVAPSRVAAVQLNYTTYVLGVPVVDAVLAVELTPAAYRTMLRFHTTGVATLFADSSVDDRASGRFDRNLAMPSEYSSGVRLRGVDRFAGLAWHDGNPVVTALTGTDDPREEVPPAQSAHTIDPMSGLALLLHQAGQSGRCDASARTYNGRRLQQFDSRTTGEEELPPSSRSSFTGRGLRCDFTERTLAGFRTGHPRADEAREHHGTIWLAPVLPGAPRLPVRAVFETPWFGDATIYLTAATP